MFRDFDNWNDLKKKLDNKAKPVIFKEKEIWWCHLGINIGDEENGKNSFFNRPVLVIKKFNQNIFLAIPLTSKVKNNKFYHQLPFQNKIQCAMLSQIKVLSSKRLSHKMGEILKKDFDEVRGKIKEMI